MNFQVSDTDLQTKRIRRTALRHAWLSFTLGAVIIAASINVVSAWLNSGPIRPAYLITMDSRTLVVALYTECVQNEQAVLLTPSDDDAAEIRNPHSCDGSSRSGSKFGLPERTIEWSPFYAAPCFGRSPPGPCGPHFRRRSPIDGPAGPADLSVQSNGFRKVISHVHSQSRRLNTMTKPTVLANSRTAMMVSPRWLPNPG